VIKEIAEFIEDKTYFDVGVDLFVGHRPQDAPDRCQVLLERSGGVLHFDLPDRVDLVVQVLSRGLTYFNARDDAYTIFNTIHGTAGWTLPTLTTGESYKAMTIEAQAAPQAIGQDDKGRYEFSTNYIFRVQNA
jgi:hypothetical protein